MSSEENKAIVRAMLEASWQGNLSELERHPGMRAHMPFLKAMEEALDYTSREIVQQLADGDWTVTRVLSTAFHKKAFMGIPAGASTNVEVIMLHRLADGLIVEQRSQGGPSRRP